MCHRVSTVRYDGHAEPVLWVTGKAGLDAKGVVNSPPHDSNVSTDHLPFLQLCRQDPMGLIVLGDHQKTCRVPVETMDDSGPQDAVDS